MENQKYSSIAEAISRNTPTLFEPVQSSSVSGGCINQTSKLEGVDGRNFFVKQNGLDFLPFFQSEAIALQEIKETATIKVPEVIAHGTVDGNSFLVLEFIQEGPPSKAGQTQLGRQLAELHKIEQPFFGWRKDNCIGATPQPNPMSENWTEFYQTHRLQHQFQLAKRKGRRFEKVDELLDGIDFFFQEYSPKPSLLHGDLWGGNASFDLHGKPFIFDPASYYGDRETDLAFTYMFGGFSRQFYDGYQSVYPINDGFSQRKILYNLYHELNHFNLFGGGYANSAQSSIHSLIHYLA